MEKFLLAIDPGTTHSAYAIICEDYSIMSAAKVENSKLLSLVKHGYWHEMAIECMESRHVVNGVIGAETYDTCYWIGRFMQAAMDRKTLCTRYTDPKNGQGWYRRRRTSCPSIQIMLERALILRSGLRLFAGLQSMT